MPKVVEWREIGAVEFALLAARPGLLRHDEPDGGVTWLKLATASVPLLGDGAAPGVGASDATNADAVGAPPPPAPEPVLILEPAGQAGEGSPERRHVRADWPVTAGEAT